MGATGDIEAVRARLASDPAFADLVRTEPRSALTEFDLSTDDLLALADDLRVDRRPADGFFQRLQRGSPPAG